ncbi:hypothetical protein KX816_07800 [Sphingosinicellaceae bacterium]|nr:hypothetical protein KX816_07800 [Sphingosinicellaceae bacterium]
MFPVPEPRPEALTVDQLAPRGLELRVTCRSCRHSTRIPGPAIVELLAARRRGPTLSEAARILRCSMCDARRPEVRALKVAGARERALERREARD